MPKTVRPGAIWVSEENFQGRSKCLFLRLSQHLRRLLLHRFLGARKLRKGSQNATNVVLVLVVVIRFSKIPKDFINIQYNTIQYNIRLLHRSQTATTSNMKHMNTKYNSRIT